MNVEVDKKVEKDTEKLPKHVKLKAAKEMKKLRDANSLSELKNVRDLKGTDEPYYRLKFGDYRYILYHNHETDIIEVVALKPRKGSYKKHNLPWRK